MDWLLIAALVGGCSRTGLIWDDDDTGGRRSGGELVGSTWTEALPCGEPVGLDVDAEGGVAVASRCSAADGTGTLLISRLDAGGEAAWEASFASARICDTDDDCRIAYRAPVVISGPRVFVACQLEGGVGTLLVVDEDGGAEPPRRIATLRPRAWLALASDQEGGVFVATETDEVMFGERIRPMTSGPFELARLVGNRVVAWVTGVGHTEGANRILLTERPDGGMVMADSHSWQRFTNGGSGVWAIAASGMVPGAADIAGISVDGADDVHVVGRFTAAMLLDLNQTLEESGQGDIFVLTEHQGTFPLALAVGDASSNEVNDLDATESGDAWIVGVGWPERARDAGDRRAFLTFVDAPEGDLQARLLPEGIVPRFVRALPSGGAVLAASVTGPLQLSADDTVNGGVLVAAFHE